MTTTINNLTTRQTTRIKEKWDRLQGQENGIDFERAKLLHRVFNRFDQNEAALERFIIKVLGEYPGKRTKMFIRFVKAYDLIDNRNDWRTLGGKGVVLLANVSNGNRRNAIRRRRDRTLARTGRATLAIATFRNILREYLGEDDYRSILTETHGRSSDVSTRQQLQTLRSFLLGAVSDYPELVEDMTHEVKHALGLDLLEV